MATLTVRYQEQLARTRAYVAATLGQAWDDLGAYYAADVDAFLELAVPVVEGAQLHAVTLTDAYLAARTGGDFRGITLDDLRLRGGPTLEEVYRRPFVTTWTALSKGKAVPDAIAAGRARAMSTGEMDVSLATRDAADAWIADDDRIVGWERVPDGGACDFCLLVSTQRYHKGDLMPLHNRCGCTVDPIMDTDTRGRILNRDRLEELRAKGVTVYGRGEPRRFGAPAAAVHDHGELGPVITDAHNDFTSEHDL